MGKKAGEWTANGSVGSPASRGRVLVVDDLLSVRLLLRAVLTEAGYTVVAEAATGREAVSLYLLFRPDVVLMDITMPEQDGLAAMEEILRHAPSAQVIVCTVLNFKQVALEALRRGACDFIAKPFRPAAVLAAVQAAMERSSREKKGKRRVAPMAENTASVALAAGTDTVGETKDSSVVPLARKRRYQ
ncbi:MAG: response regulator [Bacillota bacterium]